MGMLGKRVRGREWAGATQYVPASDLDRPRGTAGTRNAFVGRATQFYRGNRALVHALAATAGAILLTRMRRRT